MAAHNTSEYHTTCVFAIVENSLKLGLEARVLYAAVLRHPAAGVSWISTYSIRDTPEQVEKARQPEALAPFGLMVDRIVEIAVVEMKEVPCRCCMKA